jgi:ribosomal protein S18 acetylase RimI-like enzyme
MTDALPAVIVRRMTPADIPFADEVRACARWNQTPRDWQGYLGFEPEGCFVAEAGGRPAGTAVAIGYAGRIGWIGMVLVHPDYRRMGIGTALLQACLRYLQERGIATIKLDATPMGKAVYVPLGFRDEYEVTRYEGAAPAGIARPEGVTALAEAASDEIAALDARALGAARPAVLADLAGRNPELCFALHDGSQLAGSLVAREGDSALQLGPWTARDTQTADRLLQAFFHHVPGRRVFLDVPDVNTSGRELIVRHGFTVQRSFTRMFLGENAHPGEPALVFGTSGAEKG